MNGIIEKSEKYEEMAAAFQCSQIQILDNILTENGIAPDKAKEIVESYTLKFGVFLDQYWFESEVGNVFPVVGFARKHQEHNPETYIFNNGYFSFAEYAYGDTSWYYEDNAGKDEPQKMGVVGENGNPA